MRTKAALRSSLAEGEIILEYISYKYVYCQVLDETEYRISCHIMWKKSAPFIHRGEGCRFSEPPHLKR